MHEQLNQVIQASNANMTSVLQQWECEMEVEKAQMEEHMHKELEGMIVSPHPHMLLQ